MVLVKEVDQVKHQNNRQKNKKRSAVCAVCRYLSRSERNIHDAEVVNERCTYNQSSKSYMLLR